MAYPASTQTKDDALSEVNRTAIQLKQQAQRAVTRMASESVEGSYVLGMIGAIRAAISVFNAAASVPGIAQYVRDQYDDQALDVVAEFTTMRDAAIAVRDLIIGSLPKDGSGYFAIKKLESDGSITERVFTVGNTATLRTALNNLIATIR